MSFKRRVIAVIVGVALLTGVVGSSGVVADSLGLSITPQASACGSQGGDC